MLTISVKNFGPIAEGSVDLKPLTIFVGPSNTGKSYMATAVHAVMQAFELNNYRFQPLVNVESYHSRLFRRTRFGKTRANEEDSDAIRAIQDWIDLPGSQFNESFELVMSALPDGARLKIDSLTHQSLEAIRANVIHQLNQVYGDRSELTKYKRPDDFSLTVYRDSPLLRLNVLLTDFNMPMPVFDISNVSVPFSGPKDRQMVLAPGLGSFDYLAEEILRASMTVAGKTISEEFPSTSYYLPAARSGIVQGHKVLSATLVRHSSLIGTQQFNVPSMPTIAAEFLSYLISLGRSSVVLESKGNLDLATEFIEANVLQGKVDLDESVGLPYPEIIYETDVGEFPLDRSSSMVSELAPLVLFLKYLVRPGDLLIIEEPESHLHPAAQRQLARGIVRLVNAGVKVLITTHSDIIISQVNNLLALRQASPEMVEQGGFEPEDFLDPEQVGAYLFRHSQKLGGCETVPLEIDPDTGIDEDEFAAVFESIYDESIALQRDRN